MRLSPHFTLAEFLVSETAARMGRTIDTPMWVIENLTELCHEVLEPIRAKLQCPLHITSGYRPPWLNSLVRGSATSAHMAGLAADFRVPGMTPEAVCSFVAGISPRIPLDQCIDEFEQWTHVGMATKPRYQFLIARVIGGRTVYAEHTR